MKISGVMLGTKDSKKLADFYTKVFGEVDWNHDDWYGFGDKNTFITIGPHSEVGEKSLEPQRLMITLEAEDVKAEFDRLKSLGAKVVTEPYQPSMADDKTWVSTVADPDGNYLQVMTPWEG